MAPVALLLIGITLVTTYFTQALPDANPMHSENLDLALSKQKLRNVDAIIQHHLSGRDSNEHQMSPEVPPLYRPGNSMVKNDALFDLTPIDYGQSVVDGYWSLWSDWSLCSRSCGGGVAMRSRRCERRLPATCDGAKIEYMLCNTEDCSGSSLSFRELQCSQHSKRLFHYGKYSWVPYSNDGVYTCELSCMAMHYHFVQSFGIALDGTRCGRDARDMCIAGQCVKIGCDMIVDSTMAEDACGVCGGNNGTCFHYQKVFDRLQVNAEYFNYNEVARIPIGATHIFVRDFSSNFLALMEADEHFEQYIVNGNRVVSWPGEFETAGTSVKYQRHNDSEIFEIEGPTTKDLYIMILYLGHEPRIEYEYWIPNSLRPGYEDLAELRRYYQFYPEYDPLDYESVAPQETIETTTSMTIPPSTTTRTTTTSPTTTIPSTTTTILTTQMTSTPKPKGLVGGKPKQTRTSIPVTVVREKETRCKNCKSSGNRKTHYCESDFAIHVRIISKSRFRRGRNIRYDVEVVTTYKSDFKLMHREYVWVPNSCCPKLRPLRSYLLMGRKVNVDITDEKRKKRKGEHATIMRRYEARLIVGSTDYWARWKKSYEQNMAKIANKLQCEKYMLRKSKQEKQRASSKGQGAKKGRNSSK